MSISCPIKARKRLLKDNQAQQLADERKVWRIERDESDKRDTAVDKERRLKNLTESVNVPTPL